MSPQKRPRSKKTRMPTSKSGADAVRRYFSSIFDKFTRETHKNHKKYSNFVKMASAKTERHERGCKSLILFRLFLVKLLRIPRIVNVFGYIDFNLPLFNLESFSRSILKKKKFYQRKFQILKQFSSASFISLDFPRSISEFKTKTKTTQAWSRKQKKLFPGIIEILKKKKMSKNSLIDKKKILELKEIKRVVRRKRFVMKFNNEKKMKKFPAHGQTCKMSRKCIKRTFGL